MTFLDRSETALASHLAYVLNNNELRLYAQHQVDILTGQLSGAEVLMRVPEKLSWASSLALQAPFRVAPIETQRWIEVASHQGLMETMTQWLIKGIVVFLSRNPLLTVPLSFNAPPTIMTPYLVGFIKTTLKTYGVSPSMLCLEITESEKAKNIQDLARVIDTLRSMGMRVLIDDFGCGYSTMSYLVDLNVDAVKIDKSFIHKAPEKKCAFSVLRSLIDLAKSIDLKVICEGIETEEQFQIAKDLGADIAQGYLINLPGPLEKSFSRGNYGQNGSVH